MSVWRVLVLAAQCVHGTVRGQHSRAVHLLHLQRSTRYG